MKKLFLIVLIFVFSISKAQFWGTLDVKIIEKGLKKDLHYIESNIMDEPIKEMKLILKEKEDRLKTVQRNSEEYTNLENEINILKRQLSLLEKENNNKGEIEKENEIKPQIAKFYLDVSKFRVDVNSKDKPASVSILRFDKKIVYILNDEEKQYMEVPFSFMKEITGKMKNFKIDKNKREKSDIKFTGEKKKLHGFECEKVLVTDEKSNSEVWIAQKFTNLFNVLYDIGDNMIFNEGDKVLKKFAERGAFPFYEINKDKNGNITFEWEVINIDKTRPDLTVFQPPKEYKKVDFNEMNLK